MAGFSATDAALEGFRITRERPRALLAWTAFSLLVSVAGAVITLNMPADVRSAMDSLGADAAPDADVLLKALLVLSPILVFGLIVQCVMADAVYRIMLRPQDEKYSYLRLSASELRLMALTLIYLVLGVVMLLAVQLAVGILAWAASLAGQSAMVFVGSAAELFSLGLFVYVGIRMSLAPVITFDKGRLAILDSWAATRGQFWRLAGAYLLAVCCLVVLAILALLLFWSAAAIVLLSTGGQLADLSGLLQPREITLSSYLSPFMIAYMVMGSLFTAVYYAVIAAPGAYAYRALQAQGLLAAEAAPRPAPGP